MVIRMEDAKRAERAPRHSPPPSSLLLKSALDTHCWHIHAIRAKAVQIPAPHMAGTLFLGSCSYRCCQTHPLCPLHRSLCSGIHLEMLRPSQHPAPLALEVPRPLIAQLCPSHITILKPGPSLPLVLLASSQSPTLLYAEDTHDLQVQPLPGQLLPKPL